MKIVLHRLANNRFSQHFLFWCLSFLILLNILKVSAEVKQIDLIYTAVFHLPLFLIVYLNLKQFFAQLPSVQFIQVHKSYVISLSKVIYLEGNQVKIGEEKLPVSQSYKEQLVSKLG